MAKLKPFIYAFVGPQGSGKGTQTDLVQQAFQTPLVVTGDMIRQEIANNTELGKEVAQIINSGNMVTLEIWQNLMGSYLATQDLSGGLLLDGSPRNLEQAKALEELITSKKLPSVKIIYLNISRDTAIDRLAKRKICPVDYKPLLTDFCEEHQVNATTRDDDTPEAINRRLDLYFQDTHPVLNFYKQRGNEIIEINGEQSIESVSQSIVDEFTKRGLIND